MPYATDFDRPSHDDVVWGNDSLLPAYKRFDTANPPKDYLCTLGDDKHEDIAAGYVFDGDVGWLMACYDHISELLDGDKLTEKKFFKPGPPVEVFVAPDGEPGIRVKQEKRVPQGALCDNPHEGAPDAPAAVVGIFTEKAAPKFLCAGCGLVYVHAALLIQQGEFDSFEMIPVGKKEK